MSYRLPVCFVSTICPVIIMLLLFALNLWEDTCNAENEIFRNFRLYNFLNVFNYVSPWIPVTNDNCVVYVYYCHCMLYNNFVTLSCIYFTFTSFWHICMHGMSVMKAFDLEKKPTNTLSISNNNKNNDSNNNKFKHYRAHTWLSLR